MYRRMRAVAWAGAVLALMLALGAVSSGQTAVQPRSVAMPDGMVFLFDNETGASVSGLGIMFDQSVVVDGSSIVAFGGGAAGELDLVGRLAWIPVEVASGGTLQVGVSGSDIQVVGAYWLGNEMEKNKIIYRRYVEEFWNRGDSAVADEIIGSDWSWRTSASPQPIVGAEALKMYQQMTSLSFPDLHIQIEDYIAEGGNVFARVTFTGTHEGVLMGIPGTGKAFTFTDICFHRFENGRLQESVQVADMLGLLQQIGVLPPMGEDFSWGTPTSVTGDIGDLEMNRAAALVVVEAWDSHDLTLLDEVLSPQYVWHGPPMTLDLAGYKMYASGLLAAFPDLDFTVLQAAADGDRIGLYWAVSGTHLGEFLGIPPTGRLVTITGMDIHRLADGKVVETWEVYDGLALMIQLGVIPPPGG
jgi:steroid delta-isomerase-like uncharacterized protein